MLGQRFDGIQITFKVRTVDSPNAPVANSIYQRLRALMTLGGYDKEIIPFDVADKDNGGG
jgi:hypothetical protein